MFGTDSYRKGVDSNQFNGILHANDTCAGLTCLWLIGVGVPVHSVDLELNRISTKKNSLIRWLRGRMHETKARVKIGPSSRLYT